MNTLIRPIITEKSMQDAATGRFTFEVAKEADKSDIAKEAKNSFAVDVIGVKTITIKGKSRRSGRMRLIKKTSSWKKAVIEVKKGQKIDLFDTTEHAEKP